MRKGQENVRMNVLENSLVGESSKERRDSCFQCFQYGPSIIPITGEEPSLLIPTRLFPVAWQSSHTLFWKCLEGFSFLSPSS